MKLRRWIVLGLVLIVLALVARQGFDRRNQLDPLPVAPDSSASSVRSATVWFASAEGDSLVPEPRDLPEQADLHTRVAALVAALGQGPRGEAARTLPEGTTLLHAYLDETGLLTLDLSLAFRQGLGWSTGGGAGRGLARAHRRGECAGGEADPHRLRRR